MQRLAGERQLLGGKRPLSLSAALALTLFSSNALADQAAQAPVTSPDAKTVVKLTSDWPKTELINHLGTSYGTGTVGGRSASVTVLHLEKLCRAPCTTALATEGSYYVDAPGMHAGKFELPPGSKSIDVKVRGARQTPLVLSSWGVVLGGATALTGGLLWGLLGSGSTTEGRTDANGKFEYYDKPRDTSAFQAMTFIGGSVLIAGIAGLILFPRTHVESEDGTRLDASAKTKTRFTAQGLLF